MPDSHCEVYLHLVWTTYDRQELLTPETRRYAYRYNELECRRMHIEPIALNGTEDHVHLLVRHQATLTIADLARHVKGASSHWIRDNQIHEGFGWQEGYSAFSVSRWDVPKVRGYIEAQEEHHRRGTAKPALEPVA